MLNSMHLLNGDCMLTPEEMESCREDDSYERGVEAALRKNPDCRDPAHPGCKFCQPQGENDECI